MYVFGFPTFKGKADGHETVLVRQTREGMMDSVPSELCPKKQNFEGWRRGGRKKEVPFFRVLRFT